MIHNKRAESESINKLVNLQHILWETNKVLWEPLEQESHPPLNDAASHSGEYTSCYLLLVEAGSILSDCFGVVLVKST